ncbi:hypothetical protein GBAR_LOCUS1908, partial [Geodia barretti]
MLLLAFCLLFFTGRGLAQCYTSANCTGNQIADAGQRHCCVETNDGLSFNSGTSCHLCIVHGFLQTEYNLT